jgi:hypothetical protein
MAGTLKRLFGPLALTTTLTTNVHQGGSGSALIYDSIKQISVCNKTAGAVTFTLYLGATGANAAGTELFTAVSIAANTTTSYPFWGLKLTSADFLVGGASANTSLTIIGLGEQHVV